MSDVTECWDFPEPHILKMKVMPEHIDVMGHANNCEYLKWLESVAWDHSRCLGLGWDEYQALDRAMVARHTELDYLAASFDGDELLMGTWIAENDRKISIKRIYQIVRASDGVTVLRGHTRWVCVSISSGKPKRMPVEFVEGYSPTVPL